MRCSGRRLVALVCVAGAIGAAAATLATTGRIQREDRNRDGRPDLWRSYDAHGQPTRIARDNNFDGRSPMFDPSQGQAAVIAVRLLSPTGQTVALLSTLGLPQQRVDGLTSFIDSRAQPASAGIPLCAARTIRSARGPPILSLSSD